MSIPSQVLSALTNRIGTGLTGGSAGLSSLINSVSNLGGRTGDFLTNAANTASRLASGGSASGRTGRRDVLSAMQARPDPLMNFNWFAIMPLVSPKNGQSYDLGWEYVEEATLPFVEFDQVSNYRAGKNVHFPQHSSVGTLGLKLYEDSEGTATAYLNAWQATMYNPDTGLYSYPRDFKKTIQITVLDVAMNSVMVIDYMDCWPMRFDQVNLSSGSSERVLMGVEFSVDRTNIKIGKFAESEMPSLMSAVGALYPDLPMALPEQFPSNFVSYSF
jgi:hypothetical protein